MMFSANIIIKINDTRLLTNGQILTRREIHYVEN